MLHIRIFGFSEEVREVKFSVCPCNVNRLPFDFRRSDFLSSQKQMQVFLGMIPVERNPLHFHRSLLLAHVVDVAAARCDFHIGHNVKLCRASVSKHDVQESLALIDCADARQNRLTLPCCR